MTNQEIFEKFSGGFFIGDGYATIELLVNDKVRSDNILKLWAYDANLMPMPDFSTWRDEGRKEVIDYVLRRTKECNIEIWVDDMKIKERVNE